ncbi:MAG TPA: hypothetical protein PLN69_10150 [bacterium]|nr:hypothetical protein [bacterium]
MTGDTDLDSTSVPSGYVEGYIYAQSGVGRAAQDTAQNYVPLPEAEITVTCGSIVKTGVTDPEGYIRLIRSYQYQRKLFFRRMTLCTNIIMAQSNFIPEK